MKNDLPKLLVLSKDQLNLYRKLNRLNRKLKRPGNRTLFKSFYKITFFIFLALLFYRYIPDERSRAYDPIQLILGIIFITSIISLFITGITFLVVRPIIKIFYKIKFTRSKNEIENILKKSKENFNVFYKLSNLKIDYFNEDYLNEIYLLIQEQKLTKPIAIKQFENKIKLRNEFRQKKATANKTTEKLKKLERICSNNYNFYLEKYENWERNHL